MSETYTFVNLLIGDDYFTDEATLVSGQNLKRGTALGKITASGKLTALDADNQDGSAVPHSILAADCDASLGDKSCGIYVFGQFNAGAMTFAAGEGIATHKAGFRDVGIYLKTTVAA